MSDRNTTSNPESEWNQDHGCHREGIASPFTGGDWDMVENDNAAYRLARNAGFRILNPLVMTQMWMATRMYTLAKQYMTEEQAAEFYWYHRWASDLQTDIKTRLCEISALVVQNLPAKLTSLNDMLDTAMVESGFCCPNNIAAYLRDAVTSHTVSEMEKTCPDFKREWLSLRGPNAPLETD